MLQVLLIDDNPTQLRVRKEILVDAGMAVHTASTSEEALAVLRTPGTNHFDVIVTDHILPGESGATFVRLLRIVDTHTPVLAISGLAEAQNEYDQLHVRFLPKPVAPEEFLSVLRELGDNSDPGAPKA